MGALGKQDWSRSSNNVQVIVERAKTMSSQDIRFAGPLVSELFATAVQSETISIPDLLRGLEAVICAVIGREGSLQDANRGFLLLMTPRMCARQCSRSLRHSKI